MRSSSRGHLATRCVNPSLETPPHETSPTAFRAGDLHICDIVKFVQAGYVGNLELGFICDADELFAGSDRRKRRFCSKLVPVADVLQELIGNEPLGHEHLQLPTGAVYGDPCHGAQDVTVDLWFHRRDAKYVEDVVHHLVARHVHGSPQVGQLGGVEPGAAHEASAHQDLDGAELDEDRCEGVQQQLLPVPLLHGRWCRRQGRSSRFLAATVAGGRGHRLAATCKSGSGVEGMIGMPEV